MALGLAVGGRFGDTLCLWFRGKGRLASLAFALGAAICLAALFPGVSAASSPPAFGAPSAQVSEDSADLRAPIRPGGLDTTYEFWLQYAACQAEDGVPVCQAIATEKVGAGSIPGGQLEAAETVHLTSLHWGYTYSFWVSASNSAGDRATDPLEFTMPAAPPAEAPGGTGAGDPYESKEEPWNMEGAQRAAEEAPRLEAERLAKKRSEEATRAGAGGPGPAPAPAQCLVPSLRGESRAAARATLRRAHCKLGSTSGLDRGEPTPVVVGQSQPRGTRLPSGSAVSIVLGARRHSPRT